METIWDFLMNVIFAPLMVGFILMIPFGLIGEAYKWVDKIHREAQKKYHESLMTGKEGFYYYLNLPLLCWLLGITFYGGFNWWNYGSPFSTCC